MNRWNIPAWLEVAVIERDLACVYCRAEFKPLCSSRKTRATWEHIVNDAQIVTLRHIARCCASCNASKGAKPLSVWLDSAYCQSRGITKELVAEVVRRHLVALGKESGVVPNIGFERVAGDVGETITLPAPTVPNPHIDPPIPNTPRKD